MERKKRATTAAAGSGGSSRSGAKRPARRWTKAEQEHARVIFGNAHVEEATGGAVKALPDDGKRLGGWLQPDGTALPWPKARKLSAEELAQVGAEIAATDPYPFINLVVPDDAERDNLPGQFKDYDGDEIAMPKYDADGEELEYRWKDGKLQRAKASDLAKARGRRSTIGLWEIVPAETDWVWPGWIPADMLTLIDGDTKIGKSLAFVDLAARLSRGDVMPDGAPPPEGGAVVLFLGREDLWAQVTGPRLLAARADPHRIEFLKGTPREQIKSGELVWESIVLPLDVEFLRHEVRGIKARTGCRHVIVFADPLMAVVEGTLDAHNYKQTIAALAPIQRFCEDAGATFVGVRHLTKTNASGKAIHGGQGSVAFLSSARSGIMVAYDPDDDAPENEDRRRIFASVGTNLARKPKSLTFRVETRPVRMKSGRDVPQALAVWSGESSISADDIALIQQGSRGPGAQVEAMIRRMLQDGPMWHGQLFDTVEAESSAGERTIWNVLGRLIDSGVVLKERAKVRRFGQGQGRVWYALRQHRKQLEQIVNGDEKDRA